MLQFTDLDALQRRKEQKIREYETYQHKIDRLEQKVKYQRSAKDRKRTHRLIQYGATFESHHKELDVLTDEEIYSLIEKLMEIPEVKKEITEAVEHHEEGV